MREIELQFDAIALPFRIRPVTVWFLWLRTTQGDRVVIDKNFAHNYLGLSRYYLVKDYAVYALNALIS